jgi:hypothetical protein
MTADQAIIEVLRELDIQPSNNVSLFEIGTPLTAAGYDQDQILHGLFSLQRRKLIDLHGNRLQLLQPVPERVRH